MPPAFALSQDQTLRFIFALGKPTQIRTDPSQPSRPGRASHTDRSIPNPPHEKYNQCLTSVSVTHSSRRYITDTPMPINPDGQTKSRQSNLRLPNPIHRSHRGS